MQNTVRFVISIIIVFFLVTISFSLSAQEAKTLTPLILQGNDDDFFEKKVAFGRDVLVNSGYLETFAIFQAVADEDSSLCNYDGSRKIAKHLLALRYAGENRCSEIDDKLFRKLCLAVNSGDCQKLSGWRRSFCEIALKGEAEALADYLAKHDIFKDLILPIPISTDSLLVALGVYNGYKHYSSLACERFLKEADVSLSWRLSCRMIFSQDFNKDQESLLRDLSLFILDREVDEPGLCGQMENKFIQGACFDKTHKTLSDVW